MSENAAFEWTDEEWAVLAPLSQEERLRLCISTMFSGRGLLAEAKHQGLTRGGGMADTTGFLTPAGRELTVKP